MGNEPHGDKRKKGQPVRRLGLSCQLWRWRAAEQLQAEQDAWAMGWMWELRGEEACMIPVSHAQEEPDATLLRQQEGQKRLGCDILCVSHCSKCLHVLAQGKQYHNNYPHFIQEQTEAEK